jgi:hypothetical protein
MAPALAVQQVHGDLLGWCIASGYSEASSVSWGSEDASGMGMGNGDRLRILTTGVMGFSIGGGTTTLISVPTSLNGIFSDSSI